jgi:hypothetical protein
MALLDSLKISAKHGCGRGVPGGLRHSDKIGGFAPRLGETLAYSGGYTGEFPWRGYMSAVREAKFAEVCPN